MATNAAKTSQLLRPRLRRDQHARGVFDYSYGRFRDKGRSNAQEITIVIDTLLALSLGTLVIAVAAVLIATVLLKSFTVAKGDQIIVLERRWFGKQMPDGRTVALRDEVGVQARVLGPGFHLLTPFLYKVSKHDFFVIKKNSVGMVRAITGAPIPSGSFMAKAVACELFQDGEAFLRNGLKFGDMNIFHRIQPASKVVQFSVASAVEPGTFDLSAMEAFRTPGVSFFLQMPGPEEPLGVFEDMLAVTRDVAASLSADLKDEHQSVMTTQTIAHCRARIEDFSRKRMSQRAS